MAWWALTRVRHSWVFVPTVFHSLIARVKIYVLLAPDRLAWLLLTHPVMMLLRVVLITLRVMAVALIVWPLLPMEPAFLFEAANIAWLPIVLVQVDAWCRLSPSALKIVEVLKVPSVSGVLLAAVALMFPMIRMSLVVLVVLHVMCFKYRISLGKAKAS